MHNKEMQEMRDRVKGIRICGSLYVTIYDDVKSLDGEKLH